MKKTWLVFWNEYRRHVFRVRFILIVLSLPFLFLLAGLAALFSTAAMYNPRPIGFIDEGGWLVNPVYPKTEGVNRLLGVEIRPYADEISARADLEADRLQGYYVLPPDYQETGQMRLVAQKPLASQVEKQFQTFLSANLVAGRQTDLANRIVEGIDLSILRPWRDGQKDTNGMLLLLMPLAISFILAMVINTSGGFMIQSVVEEKENRTMEIIITSISPEQLMSGKVLGSLCVGLTQIFIWGAIPVAVFLIMRDEITALAGFQINPRFLWVSALALTGGLILISGLMTGLSALAAENREAQQFSMLFTLPVSIPYFFTFSIAFFPNGALARGLSYFPLTAVTVLPMRVMYDSHLPDWEIALSLGLLYASAFGALWLAGRALRLGMLRYGKPVKLKELLGKR